MHSKDWYREFRIQFNPKKDPNVAEMYKQWPISDGKWTALMAKMLKSLASRLDYEVNEEESMFRQQRFDMKWERRTDHDEIFIEHECNPIGILTSELPKLLNASGRLRVLITYLPASKFPGESTVHKLLETLKEKKAGENFEFLLVFGTYRMDSPTDWVGHAFFPTYDVRPLIVPSRLPYT